MIELTPEGLNRLTDDQLAALHDRLHEMPSDLSKEEAVNAHALLIQEMHSRKLDHPMPQHHPELDETEPVEKAEEPILLVENFVSLIGSSVKNPDKANDIDLLLRIDKDKLGPGFWTPSFRLALRRALAPDKDRPIHIVYDEQGPHAESVPLYHLALIPASRKIREIAKAEPGKPFTPWKPGVEFSSSEADKVWQEWASKISAPIYVQQKYDGYRAFLHRQGDRYWVLTEEGKTDLRDRLPDFDIDLGADYIIDGELELYAEESGELNFPYRPGDKIERMDMASLLRKEPAFRFRPKLWAFDLVFYSESLERAPYQDRFQKLREILPSNEFIVLAWNKVAETEAELSAAIHLAARRPHSEGAILKSSQAPYAEGVSRLMAKAKNYKEVIVRVVDKEKTDADTYVYTAALADGTIIGRTLATKYDAKIGDLLEIRVGEIKLENGKLTWDNPIVHGPKGAGFRPTSSETAKRLAQLRRTAAVVKSSSLLIVSDGPGRFDLEEPFSGPSSRLLKGMIQSLGVDPEELDYAYLFPGPVAKITPERAAKARDRLLSHTAAKTILALGKVAFSGLTDSQRNEPVTVEDKKVIPAPHPAAILRTGGVKSKSYPVLRQRLKQALREAGLL